MVVVFILHIPHGLIEDEYYFEQQEKEVWMSPDWCGSVDSVSTHKPKGGRFDCPLRAYAWVSSQVPNWGLCKRQWIDVSLAHLCFSPLLPLSLALSLKINIKKNLLLLAIVNCVAMNIGVHRFFWIGVSGFLGYNPSSSKK